MFIEISRELVTAAERNNHQAIEMLIKLSHAIKYNKHIVFAGAKLLDRIISLNALDGHERQPFMKVRRHYSVIGALSRKIDFRTVVLVNGNNCRTKSRILLNANKTDRFEIYEECHLLTENLQDGDFFKYLVDAYIKTIGTKGNIEYMPLMGGGATIAKVYEMEINKEQHFCVAILDSDKKYPTCGKGDTFKTLKRVDGDLYLDEDGNNGQRAFNCSYYVMEDLRELENLIPISVLKSMATVSAMPLMQMSFDMSFYDMKEGLWACKINFGDYQDYLDRLFSFDANIVADIDFCADYRRLCDTKDEFEKGCGRMKIAGGLGSKIMEQVLKNAGPALAANSFSGMSVSQQHEWRNIGKKIYEWCCCMDVGARV